LRRTHTTLQQDEEKKGGCHDPSTPPRVRRGAPWPGLRRPAMILGGGDAFHFFPSPGRSVVRRSTGTPVKISRVPSGHRISIASTRVWLPSPTWTTGSLLAR